MNSLGDSAVIRAQCLARQWMYVLQQCLELLDEMHTFSMAVDSNPEVFFFFLAQNGEFCSVDASALKSRIPCTSCTWLAGCMMKGRE